MTSIKRSKVKMSTGWSGDKEVFHSPFFNPQSYEIIRLIMRGSSFLHKKFYGLVFFNILFFFLEILHLFSNK